MSQALAKRELDFRSRMIASRSAWLPLWHEAAVFCCPDRRQILTNTGGDGKSAYRPLTSENSLAKDCLNVFAGGMKQWIIPGQNGGWMQWQPQVVNSETSDVREWLIECTERAEALIDNSGFYNSGHEVFKDLGWAGVGGLLLLEGTDKVFYAQALAPTEFVFQTHVEGLVNRAAITFNKRASELVALFGDACSEKIKTANATNRGDEQFEVVLSLYRRAPDEIKVAAYPRDPAAMPYGACWIEVNGISVLKEEGYEEMPLIVPRWDKWSNSNDYAASPAMNAIADIKGINVIDMIEGVLIETQLDPRMMRKTGEMGAIDLAPGGITEVSDMNMLKTWAHEGQVRESAAHQERKGNQIRRMFYVDTFEPLMGINRDMNIPEIQERQQASMNRLAPTV